MIVKHLSSAEFHYLNIFPGDIDLVKIRASFENIGSPCHTVMGERDLSREHLDDPDYFILFWKRLPPWITMECNATLGLFDIGPFDSQGRFTKDPSHYRTLYRDASRVRAFFILHPPPFIVPPCTRMADFVIGGSKAVFTTEGEYQRRYTILTYGPLGPYGMKVRDFLKKKLGGSYVHYEGSPERLPGALRQTLSILYLAEPGEIVHPVKLLEGMYSGAMMMSNINLSPMSYGGGQFLQAFQNTGSSSSTERCLSDSLKTVIRLVETREYTIYASHAYDLAKDWTAQVALQHYVIPTSKGMKGTE